MMNKRWTMLPVLGVAALLLVFGCASPRQWTRPGLTQSQFDEDAARCRKEAARATYQDPFRAETNQGLERTVAQEKRFEQCMFAQGYRLEESDAGK